MGIKKEYPNVALSHIFITTAITAIKEMEEVELWDIKEKFEEEMSDLDPRSDSYYHDSTILRSVVNLIKHLISKIK